MIMVERSKAHSHELGEEEDEDSHQGNAFDPRVFGDGPGETWVCKGFVGRCKEVDECCCDDDPGTEVFGNKESPLRDTDAFMASSIDRKSSTCINSCQSMTLLR